MKSPSPAQAPGGRRTTVDTKDRYNDVACGKCEKVVPDGAHIVVNYRHFGHNQLFCPGCCPCREQP